jgi:hypothetical protein
MARHGTSMGLGGRAGEGGGHFRPRSIKASGGWIEEVRTVSRA